MGDQHRALLLAFLLMVLGSCRKDKDASPPTVNILLPGAGSTLFIPDTLMVRAHVSDDGTVEHLTVLLADDQGIPIAAPVTVTIGDHAATVDLALPVTNERIGSGTYTLVARASDGTNDGQAFQDITVHAAPLRLRSVFVLPPGSGAPPYPITRIDSTGNISAWAMLNELGGAAIGLDHVYVAGTTSQGLVRWDVGTGGTSQLLANQGTGTAPWFHGLTVDPADGRPYVGTRDGHVRGYFPSGGGSFTATSPVGWYSERTAVVGGQLASIAFDPVSAQRKIVTYDLSSGSLRGQFALDNAPVALYQRNGDHVLVFGNRNGDGVVQERNVDQGGVFEMRTFAGDTIHAVARIDPDTFIIARASGMARFTRNTNGLVPLPALQATALAYDKASGALLVGAGDRLITMDPLNGNILDDRTMPSAIGTILPLTNR